MKPSTIMHKFTDYRIYAKNVTYTCHETGLWNVENIPHMLSSPDFKSQHLKILVNKNNVIPKIVKKWRKKIYTKRYLEICLI